MIRAFFLISALCIFSMSCNEQPKTTEADSASVVFVNDTANQKVDVQLNGKPFTSYHYQASLPKPVLFPLVTAMNLSSSYLRDSKKACTQIHIRSC